MRTTIIHINFHMFLITICFFMSVWLPEGVVAQSRNNTTASVIPVDVAVGVVLDMDSLVGKIGLSCMNMALSDFYATHPHYNTRLVFKVRDSMDEVVTAASAGTAVDLIRNVQVQAIIGPRSSMQANFVIGLGNKSQVPIISFSATSPSLTSLRSPYFFRAVQSGSFQVKAISAIIEAFKWQEAVPIYVDNQFGETLIPYLADALQAINTRVPNMRAIPESATDDQIKQQLQNLMNLKTRVFILHAPINLGSRILAKAKENGMMSEGYVWIMTQSMTTMWRTIDSSAINNFQGILGVRPYVPNSKELVNYTARWKRKFQADNPNVTNAEMNLFGLWAYDATIALAIAIEKAGTQNLRFNKTNGSNRGVSSIELETLGVSQNGPRLIQELSNINFTGLSGDFHFVNGQLESNIFQIVNINGNGERGVGFWTAQGGLVKDLVFKNSSANSTFRPKLGPIIWPGDTTSVPKRLNIPTDGKKLKFGVPVNSFKEFVEVIFYPNSNKTKLIQGYTIDMFNAVLDRMPYVPHEYLPFETPERKTTGYYEDLVDQVYYGKYDAVIGDITILANRSLYVDFTLPYTESGVSMLVPVRDNKNKDAWVFLRPLTSDLWVTSGSFFVFIGFVVWILEHRINNDFRGPPSHQLGTSFWFSFSTMMFAQREKVVSNLGRFVVIIWCFVVLILTISYTASLTSLLTVEQLQPTVTDVNMLLKRRENVGFQTGSYVEGKLLELKFDKSQLKNYSSLEQLYDLFRNGSIAAAFDESPYFKLFLSKYCGNYTTVVPSFRTDGFGFVFPKGSLLVANVSSALLNVTQGGEIKRIQDKWFKNDDASCSDFNPTASSNSLGLESFWGLFLIAGVASISALIIFAVMFLYEQRHVLFRLHPETSMWRKLQIASRIFDEKDLSSHTFKRTESTYASSHSSVHSAAPSSSNTNCPPSPSRTSNQIDSSEFVFIVEQGTVTDSLDISPSLEIST